MIIYFVGFSNAAFIFFIFHIFWIFHFLIFWIILLLEFTFSYLLDFLSSVFFIFPFLVSFSGLFGCFANYNPLPPFYSLHTYFCSHETIKGSTRTLAYYYIKIYTLTIYNIHPQCFVKLPYEYVSTVMWNRHCINN